MSFERHISARPFLPWSCALAMAVAVLGGCTTVEIRPAAPVAEVRENPVLTEAGELLRSLEGLPAAARQAPNDRIDALLSQLDNETLAREAAALPVGHPLYNHVGRALLRRGLPLPRPFDRAAWQFDASTRPPADPDGYRPPMRVAMLLPLSGNTAAAAAPVRDGFLTGYYGEYRRRPEIVFYDTHGTPGGAVTAYEEAVLAGHDFVVGPLTREGVSMLFSRGPLPVAVLALNRGTVPPPPGNASFSLSPEDEGIAAAELLLDRGARRVLVIGGEDDIQRRTMASLRERLGERGAVVTDVVGAGVTDLSPFAQKDVDAVFLAVRGGTARELMPALALAGLAGKPRVATSQLLSGTGKAEEDRVLDGTVFPSETWTTRGSVRGLAPAASIAQKLPTARGPAARLFAFGYDAWLLTAYLERLALSADGTIEGATGTLRIDGFGNILRTPSWSTFSSGVPIPMLGAGRR
ncbi:MAG: penicillin-binding protein activator [Pseudomonadota bacterium]|nr:penicillin-binding protein activator [Pseudomonadota bacterium]